MDIVVHNAGITRDKLLVNMDPALELGHGGEPAGAAEHHPGAAGAEGVLEAPRIVSLGSQSGIAGNRGQTNYAATKAGVIGMVRAWAAAFAERRRHHQRRRAGLHRHRDDGEDADRHPRGGSRLNSLQQGGLPVDVAETVAWLASEAGGGVNGQTVRVCGQSMVGA